MRAPVLWLGLALGLAGACAGERPTAAFPSGARHATPGTALPVALPARDPFVAGPHGTTALDVRWGTAGLPATVRVHRPQETGGPWPVVLLLPGFAARNTAYDELAHHVASQGAVVVVPQPYAPGLGVLLHTPTVSTEAAVARALLAWLPAGLASAAGVRVDPTRVLLAGHSRGGKVAWRLLREDPSAAQAVALLDPVDGHGGPLRPEGPDADRPHPFAGPVLVIGAGIGGRCAPEAENHARFASSAAPGRHHVVVPGMGHADFLDEDAARAAALLCGGGEGHAASRRLVAGLLAAFLRARLGGEPHLAGRLADPSAAPRPFTVR